MKSYMCLLYGVALLASTLPAMAFCNVPQPRLVCAEYSASRLVVEATLVRTRTLQERDDPQGISAHLYTLSVSRVLRGRSVGNIQVYEGNDSGRANFNWTPGTTYLLFLFYSSSEKAWQLDGCGNSRPVSEAGAALSEINSIRGTHDGGVIYGAVSGQLLSVPVPGVRVEARGSKGYFAATTDTKGEFQIKVPAGVYSIRVTGKGQSFGNADISYEDPHNIRIEPGGCGQVQFSRVR
jgi:hypothetical protein